MADRITGRLDDGTVFVHSETGNEGVGHFTTQRRLPEICCKLAKFEDEIENGELVEVVHGEWREVDQTGRNPRHIQYTTKQCSVCGYWNGRRKTNYCPNCGAKMDKIKRK